MKAGKELVYADVSPKYCGIIGHAFLIFELGLKGSRFLIELPSGNVKGTKRNNQITEAGGSSGTSLHQVVGPWRSRTDSL